MANVAVVITHLGLLLPVIMASEPCSSGKYMDLSTVTCTPCSRCQINHIVRKPCSMTLDTECGPFYEFNFFNQDSGEHGDGTDIDRNVDRQIDTEGEGRIKTQDGVTVGFNTGSTSPGEVDKNKDAAVEADPDKWKELCFGLIGAMAAVTLLALLYVVITHVRHRNGACKMTSLSDPESPVVYYHTQLPRDESSESDIRLPHLESQLQQNREKKFLRRIFQPSGSPLLGNSNEYVDEVYDPKSSATPFLLHSIPESEIPNFPLSQVHKNYKKRLERTKQVPGSYPGATDGNNLHVTQMLLTHHKCECDST